MNIMSSSARSKRGNFAAGAIGTFFVLPQNGVVEGSVHFDSGNPASSLMARPCGRRIAGDAQARPKVLKVGTPSTAGKVRADINDNGDSLPSTPEVQSDLGPDTDTDMETPGDEVMQNDTREHISTFLRAFVAPPRAGWRQGKVQDTMKRVVDDVLAKHLYAYNGMIKKLCLDERGDDMSFVMSVAKSLFADGTTNWGRIASLLAFGAVVCRYLKQKGREHCVALVAHEISSYLLLDQRAWLAKNNAWDGFVEFFQVADPETTVRNTLMAFAGFAGIGATLALLIRAVECNRRTKAVSTLNNTRRRSKSTQQL